MKTVLMMLMVLSLTRSADAACQLQLYQSDAMDGATSAANRVQPDAVKPRIPILGWVIGCPVRAGEGAAWLIEYGSVADVDRPWPKDSADGRLHQLPPPDAVPGVRKQITAISVMVGPVTDLPKTVGQWRSASLPVIRVKIRIRGY